MLRKNLIALFMLFFVASIARAQPELGGDARRKARRSPAVEVFERCKDSVVFITFPLPKGGNSSLNEFFFMPDVKDELGVGSGIIIHEGGYVLTAAHVLSPIVMQARLSDGKVCMVDVVAKDTKADLAVLKIRADHALKPVTFAPNRDVMIGETVIVIGSPFGLSFSCSVGVVSAIDRTATANLITLPRMIQTDAAINPGNSGGPMLNVLGEVIGLVAVNKNEGKGVGFAVPVESIRRGLASMLEPEVNQRLNIGMSVAPEKPFLVRSVGPNSPALQADIQAGDELTQVGGKPLQDLYELYLALLDSRPGGEIAITRKRDSDVKEVRLKLQGAPHADFKSGLSRFGLKAEPLTILKANAMHMRVPKGIVITEVQSDLFKDAAPKPGDVLARVGDIRPDNLQHAGRLLAEAKTGQPLHLVFLRQKEKEVFRYDVTVTPEK
ncbi:MAG TPA: trypsin-like peptidase domain-containing protein [Gemmataceae bacterium]|jgi:serine protease Do|nr:trypsin-like peptidase domain-containing protein [Gemmataceae bacterium]